MDSVRDAVINDRVATAQLNEPKRRCHLTGGGEGTAAWTRGGP